MHESHAGHGCAPGNASLLNSAEMVDSTCSPSEMVLNLFSLRTCTFHLELSGFTFWITSLRTVLGCPAPHAQFKYVLIHNILIGLSDLICVMKLACPFRELVLLGPIFRTNECLQWLLFSAQYFDLGWWIALLHKSSIPNELPIRPGVHASVGISDVSSPPPMPEMESSKLGWCCPVLLREPYDNVLHPKIHDFTSTILDFDRSAPEGKLMCRVSSVML